jgi:hypothetical protein
MGVRGLATIVGISSATLSRVENGGAIDHKTIMKILKWLFEVKP